MAARRGIALALVVASVCGCGREQTGTPSAAVSTPCPSVTAHATAHVAGPRMKAKCLNVGDIAAVHIAITTTYTYSGETAKVLGKASEKRRELWNFDCDLKKKPSCEGVEIDLTKMVDGDQPLTWAAPGAAAIANIKVISRTPSIVVFQWGPYRTFTLDTVANTVAYTESGPATEARGVGSCTEGADIAE